MPLTLYAHPFSSYCQKVLTGLYENAVDFDYRLLAPDEPENGADLARLWPIGKFPVLTDGGRTLIESSVILEYLDQRHPGPVRLIPDAPDAALQVRFLDRFFDNYVMTPMQRIVADFIRQPPGAQQLVRVGVGHNLLILIQNKTGAAPHRALQPNDQVVQRQRWHPTHQRRPRLARRRQHRHHKAQNILVVGRRCGRCFGLIALQGGRHGHLFPCRRRCC